MSVTALAERLSFVEWNRSNFIGGGTFGRVYAGTRRPKTQGTVKWGEAEVAVKVLNTPKDQKDIVMLMREIEIMASIRHPSLLSLFAWGMDQSPDGASEYIMVTQRLYMGLDKVLDAERKGTSPHDWDATRKSQCLLGIAAGMCYLHNLPKGGGSYILHRDLKPENVLMTKDLLPVITDFGLSKSIDANRQLEMTMQIGSPAYMAPELLVQRSDSEESYSRPVDVYSFGIIAYEMLTGNVPYSDKGKVSRDVIYNTVIAGKRPSWIGTAVHPDWIEWVEKLWAQNPDDRPTFVQVCAQADLLMLEGCDPDAFMDYKEKVLGFLAKP